MKKKSKSSGLNSSVSPVVLIALAVLVFGLILAVVEGKKSQFLGSDASEGKTPPPPRPSGWIQVTRPATQIPSSRTTTNPSYMPKPITSGFPPSGFIKPTGYTR